MALVFVIDACSLWLEPSWGFGHHGAQIQPVQEGQGDGRKMEKDEERSGARGISSKVGDLT